jgi:hypothetical protein
MSILKNAIEALDPTPDQKKEITLLLSLLSELCEQKVNEFSSNIENELRLAGSGENKTIPVTEILARHREYRAYIKKDAGKIATEVSNAIKKFISGGTNDIIDGVASLVTTGIEAIIGAGSGTQQEMSSYYIIVQDYGIARYDIRVWARQIEAQGITSQIETALATVAFKSSVDISKISFNTFLIAYGSQLENMNFPKDKQREYLDYAIEIYNKLRGQMTGEPMANELSANSSISPTINFRVPGKFYGTLWD